MNKVLVFIFLIILAVSTVAIVQFKPEMHQSLLFEQIIFKRSAN
mgnify:CR=1 FL=1